MEGRKKAKIKYAQESTKIWWKKLLKKEKYINMAQMVFLKPESTKESW